MSETESPTNMEARLNALQCHFTWDEVTKETKLLSIKDDLEDIGTEEGNCWLPHIYNLLSYLHHRLDSDQKALELLNLATKDFHRRHQDEEGPWLMVNYGNLAWLHHLMGQQSESHRYLSLAEALMREHSVMQGKLHSEVAAEKAWTLMALVADHLKTAEDLFLAAIKKEPQRVEWKSSLVLAIIRAQKHDRPLKKESWKRLQRAREEDPENLYVAVKHLWEKARAGEYVTNQARELARQVLRNPVSSYSGLKQIIRLYREFLSIDEAIKLTERAVEEHPEERFLKRCAALCYNWKIYYNKGRPVTQAVMDRAICLHHEVIDAYPDTCLIKEINLAEIHACTDLDKAEQIYQELLARPLNPDDRQMLFCYYGRCLFHKYKDLKRSEEYNMKSAKMEPQTYFRDQSIRFLQGRVIAYRTWAQKIVNFLESLPNNEPSV